MAEELGQATTPALHPARITLPPSLVLCELSLHTPEGYLCLSSDLQCHHNSGNSEINDQGPKALFCSVGCTGVSMLSPAQLQRCGTGCSGHQPPPRKALGLLSFSPRDAWFGFQSRSSPQASSQLLHPSLFPGFQCWWERPRLSPKNLYKEAIMGDVFFYFLTDQKKKIKNHHSDTIKTSTNLSGNSGAERDYPGTPLDPLSSHQTDHSWELNLAAMKDLPLSWPISWNLSWEFKEGNLLMQRLQCCTGTSAHQAFKGSVWDAEITPELHRGWNHWGNDLKQPQEVEDLC